MEEHIDRQIFIGGCSRSGTTLLGAILGAHSECICAPESHFKISVLRACGPSNGHVDSQAALKMITRHWRFKLWELDVDPARAPEGSYARLLEWLVAQYAGRRRLTGRIWVDHTPENINYAPTLLNLFPKAKIVHIVRDGRGVAASIMPLDWGPNTIVETAKWWQEMVTCGLAMEALLPSDRIVRIKYEDLVRAPEETVGRLCDDLDLDYEPTMLQANGFQPPHYTASQHTLIGRCPDAERAARWRTDLTPRQIEIFESLASDLLDRLGYPLLYGSDARSPAFLERQGAAVEEVFRSTVVNTIRWLIRSYPVWLSWDFLHVLADSRRSYHKTQIWSSQVTKAL